MGFKLLAFSPDQPESSPTVSAQRRRKTRILAVLSSAHSSDQHASQQLGAPDLSAEPKLLVRAYALGLRDQSEREQVATAPRRGAEVNQPQVRQE